MAAAPRVFAPLQVVVSEPELDAYTQRKWHILELVPRQWLSFLQSMHSIRQLPILRPGLCSTLGYSVSWPVLLGNRLCGRQFLHDKDDSTV